MAAFKDVSSPDLEHFKGGKWTDWLEAVQPSEASQISIPDHASKRDVEVARLHRNDMSLFGYRPANDNFYLVTCEHCGHLVKPQSLSIHYERRHADLKISKLSIRGKSRAEPTNHKLSHSPHPRHSKTTSDRVAGKTLPVIVDTKKKKPDDIAQKGSQSNAGAVKTVANSPARTVKPPRTVTDEPDSLERTRKHHSKPSGTIRPRDIVAPHVAKHLQKTHRSSERDSDSKTRKSDRDTSSGSKLRKNHDGYNHHLHNAARRPSKPDPGPLLPEILKAAVSPIKGHKLPPTVPVVVLKKASLPPGIGIKVAHKRTRPLSGGSDSSTASSRDGAADKVATRVPETPPPAKVRKKEKILPLKDREYDPNKHCGVWVKDDNAHCRRSLTCKVHPLSAKRNVAGRIKSYDELVQEHGREKQQRLKEKALSKAASSPMPPPPSPSVQSITSPMVLSPGEFAVPSPATKATPLSPPCTPTTLPTAQPHVSNATKAKPSVSLFPRIFAAWHVDCWDSDEVEDTAAGTHDSCHFVPRHPQPLVVLNTEARRSGNCHVSYSRNLERQLEAISTNLDKISVKQSKKSKPFSFTPIPAGTLVTSRGSGDSKQKLRGKLSNPNSRIAAAKTYDDHSRPGQNCQNRAARGPGSDTGRNVSSVHIKLPKTGIALSRKLSNAVPGVKHNLPTSLGLKPGVRTVTTHVAGLLRTNSVGDSAVFAAQNPNCSSPLVLMNSDAAASPVNTVSAQNIYSGTGNSAQDGVKDQNQLVVQLPNGLKSLPGNFLLKQGSHSVTLSGNIGALTVPNDDVNFMGSQVAKTAKTLRGNNNFVVQNDTNNNTPTICKQSNGPTILPQASQLNTGTVLTQNDVNSLHNQHGQQQFINDHLAEALASLDSQNQDILESSVATNDLMKFLSTDDCDQYSGKIDKCGAAQLPSLHDIDPSIFEQVLATSNHQPILQSTMTVVNVSHATVNTNLTADSGRNFANR